MAEPLKSWNLQSFVVTLGLASLSGAGEDGLCTGSPMNPKFKTIEGANGALVRYYTGSKAWTFKISLLQTSDDNDVLTAMHAADVLASQNGLNGAGVFPFQISAPLGGRLVIFSPAAFIEGPPEVPVNAKPGTYEWSIVASEVSEYIGGT